MAKRKTASRSASSSSLTVRKVLEEIEARAPGGTAEDWDNVGLLVGDAQAKTRGAVVCIDLTEGAIREAEKRGFKLIVNHHPCIFPKNRGLARVTAPSLVYEAAQKGISVIACHTNFDRCALEALVQVCTGLGARPIGRLIDREPLKKLVVFVPIAHAEKVREAVCAAGAGQIGNYDSCSFSGEGIGTFRGGETAKPFLGKPGRLERAAETRLETIFPAGLERPVLAALRASHPYEEVAYDLYSVEQKPVSTGMVRGLGYGFIGEFDRARSFSEVARSVRRLFKLGGFWITNPEPTRVKRVAFVAGKGSSFVPAAIAAGCELFVTGEVGYHGSLDSLRKGMGVMELGHRESEKFFLSTMGDWLQAMGLAVSRVDEPIQKIWTS